MTDTHGLSTATLEQIFQILSRFPKVESAILFGSRAKGVHRRGSDIDLALVGSDLDLRELGRIADAFYESSLPYEFSLIQYNADTDPSVAAHVKRVGKVLYARQPTSEGPASVALDGAALREV